MAFNQRCLATIQLLAAPVHAPHVRSLEPLERRDGVVSQHTQYLTPSPLHFLKHIWSPAASRALHSTVWDVELDRARTLRLIDSAIGPDPDQRHEPAPELRAGYDQRSCEEISDSFPFCSELGRDYDRHDNAIEARVGVGGILEAASIYALDFENRNGEGQPSASSAHLGHSGALIVAQAEESQSIIDAAARQAKIDEQRAQGPRKKYVRKRKASQPEKTKAAAVRNPTKKKSAVAFAKDKAAPSPINRACNSGQALEQPLPSGYVKLDAITKHPDPNETVARQQMPATAISQ